MDVLAFPFRLTTTGTVALVEQGSEAHLAQQAYQFVSTRPREIPLAPLYGVDDPLFRNVSEGEIVTGLAVYHPDMNVEAVDIKWSSEGTKRIAIEFSVKTAPAVPVEAEVRFGA